MKRVGGLGKALLLGALLTAAGAYDFDPLPLPSVYDPFRGAEPPPKPKKRPIPKPEHKAGVKISAIFNGSVLVDGRWCRPGERVGDIEIVEVAKQRVKIRRGAHLMTLHLDGGLPGKGPLSIKERP